MLLPTREGRLEPFSFAGHEVPSPSPQPPRTRVAIAAAHVVADPFGDASEPSAIDWDQTLAYRRHLWGMGFGVAEAMDTAQRGSGLLPSDVRSLIQRSIVEAKALGAHVTSGINTDEIDGQEPDLESVVQAYLGQMDFVQSHGGSVVVMASRSLAAAARGPDDYHAVYARILAEAEQPVILHWLGHQFDPLLTGYWGSTDETAAMTSLLDIVEGHREKVDGVKISLLDDELEVEFRRSLPGGVRCYTGDDFNYLRLIKGDDVGHSDALLGIFDAIGPVASAALRSLDEGDTEDYERLLAPTVPLSRHLFSRPTYNYKTGLVFLAYLNGHQDHFRMIGGRESARSIVHLAETVRLADAARLFVDPEDAERRLVPVLQSAGVW